MAISEKERVALLHAICEQIEDVMARSASAIIDLRDPGHETSMYGETPQGSVEQTIRIAQYSLERSNARWVKLQQRRQELETESFNGFCEDCGMQIPIERLIAQPTTHRCVQCKETDEMKNKNLFGSTPGRHHISAYTRAI